MRGRHSAAGDSVWCVVCMYVPCRAVSYVCVVSCWGVAWVERALHSLIQSFRKALMHGNMD
jgi:hypothetical protein